MSWTMTSRRVLGGMEVAVGSLCVAKVRFARGTQPNFLILPVPAGEQSVFPCSSVKEALKLLHTKLNSPPPEGFDLPKFKETPHVPLS